MAAAGAPPPAAAGGAERLLDFSQPFDVPLLDATVAAFYGTGAPEERNAAELLLNRLKEHPDMWMRVNNVLESSTNANSKFFALQVLEELIKFKWGTLPSEQREGIKNYISNVIVQMSGDDTTFRRERVYVNKLNVILVQVLKHEWPAKWPRFLPDLVGAAKSSETLCENCMVILKLLSEEVFDFSRGELTQQKTKELKNSLNNEFALVHELCEYVLMHSQRVELVKSTLETLQAFLSWVPLGYIFESSLVETLLKLFPMAPFRNVALKCLTEIGSLNVGAFYDAHFVNMFLIFMGQLQQMLPRGTNIPEAYANGSDDEQAFVQNLASFIAGFCKVHLGLLEQKPDTQAALLSALEYLLGISYVEEVEVFKVCLDYWNLLVCDLFQTECTDAGVAAAVGPGASPFAFGAAGGLAPPQPAAGPLSGSQRKQLYAAPMSKLRLLMVSRMAKPEEVIVVEDENGNIVRDTMKDNDVLVQYKIMRETLIYLSHLNHEDTENQMLEKLANQLNGKEYSWGTLNTLCWAIGSISGSMAEEQENRFLVTVIRDLLNLCEITRGKDHKAVIASNIMYVVGQYPRFLRLHWKFLKTVVNKLFEFMHETHPGVQDMACETFSKIVNKCKRKFVVLQVGESEPFISELLRGLGKTIKDLEPHQVHSFYESVGAMIGSETDPQRREEYLRQLMEPPNSTWTLLIAQARDNVEVLKQAETIRNVANILRTNVSVARSLGQPFQSQVSMIYADMLNVYRLYSELVNQAVQDGGAQAARTSLVKLLRSVKREVLNLIETFVDKCEDPQLVAQQLVPAMMDPVLGDYARNVPDARDAEVLSLFASIINSVKGAMMDEVPRVFAATFECTLEMIKRNFEDYPDHRPRFFSLLRAIVNHCFRSLFSLSQPQLRLVIDSIVWAFRHTERNVADTGLCLLLELLNAFKASEFANQFYQTYCLNLMREIFTVLSDTLHKANFKMHATILQHFFTVVEDDTLTAPLWDVAELGPSAAPNNAVFVRDSTVTMLSTSFPNIPYPEVQQLVQGMFELKGDFTAFKNHLRDFLVKTKQFGGTNNEELWADERAAAAAEQRQRMLQIGGMINPNEMPDDMLDA